MTIIQTALAEFSWYELYELHSTLVGISQGPESVSIQHVSAQPDKLQVILNSVEGEGLNMHIINPLASEEEVGVLGEL